MCKISYIWYTYVYINLYLNNMHTYEASRRGSKQAWTVHQPSWKNPWEIVKDFFTTADVPFTRAFNRGVMLHVHINNKERQELLTAQPASPSHRQRISEGLGTNLWKFILSKMLLINTLGLCQCKQNAYLFIQFILYIVHIRVQNMTLQTNSNIYK